MYLGRLAPIAAVVVFVCVGCFPELEEGEPEWFCEDDTDCGEPGFRCDTNTNRCVFGAPPPPECIDIDDDGYGVGEDRSVCRFRELDPEPTDPFIYPEAPDICDGKDNDGDGAVDPPIACNSISDCPENRPDDTLFFCENSVCVLKPSRQPVGVAECEEELECISGAYEAVPVTCL